MIPIPGPRDSTAKGPSGRQLAPGRHWKGTRMGKKPWSEATRLLWSKTDGDDLMHSDGGTVAKTVELIEKHKDQPFWLGIGFVRPHIPFVAPRSYYPPFLPYNTMKLPRKVPENWDDIPKAGINYKTSLNMKENGRAPPEEDSRRVLCLGCFHGGTDR